MKFSTAIIPLFSLLVVAAASSSAIYSDSMIARDLVTEFTDDVVERSEDGMLFRRLPQKNVFVPELAWLAESIVHMLAVKTTEDSLVHARIQFDAALNVISQHISQQWKFLNQMRLFMLSLTRR
ncbi:hypothetical protein CPB83DRAFT_860258 [Crepidotus variabilis]|uniref:Uncharacterized protein n=1 Tax=Crepidotus variabilis TaxID=179855 RepID=A0A9P6JLW7_9AGAR|nr:hypothetical protein CPB83DRAFT_860258 [Crepidotus variabilis]